MTILNISKSVSHHSAKIFSHLGSSNKSNTKVFEHCSEIIQSVRLITTVYQTHGSWNNSVCKTRLWQGKKQKSHEAQDSWNN